MRTCLVAIAVAVTLEVVPLVAHHSFSAEFDAAQPVKFKGTVTSMEWTNPHSWIHIDVKGEDGAVQSWAVETGTPNVLYRRGFSKQSLQPGTEIVVDGYRAKDGSHRINGRDVTLPNGQTLFIGSPGTPGTPSEDAATPSR